MHLKYIEVLRDKARATQIIRTILFKLIRG